MAGPDKPMDTRSKILTPERALALPRGALAVVTGTFNPLLAEHARALAAVRNRTPERPLLAVILPAEPALLPAEARAALVAATRMVDYVLIANREQTDQLIETLAPAETVRLEADDAVRTRRLIEHVQRRQTR
jgi:glycerol-3-phosphate cytidylyltransferase-like family protein